MHPIQVYKFWKTRSHNCMTMEMLGDNLFDRFCQCSYQFSKKTIYMIAIQVLERLEDLHGTGHVHRDLKPENMVVGEDGGIIHLIDIGLAKPFMDPRTGRHVKKCVASHLFNRSTQKLRFLPGTLVTQA